MSAARVTTNTISKISATDLKDIGQISALSEGVLLISDSDSCTFTIVPHRCFPDESFSGLRGSAAVNKSERIDAGVEFTTSRPIDIDSLVTQRLPGGTPIQKVEIPKEGAIVLKFGGGDLVATIFMPPSGRDRFSTTFPLAKPIAAGFEVNLYHGGAFVRAFCDKCSAAGIGTLDPSDFEHLNLLKPIAPIS